MNWRVSTAALIVTVLAGTAGCRVHVDGDNLASPPSGSNHLRAGGVINVTEPVAGDAFLAGGRIAIASEVEGDLVAAGGELSLGGAVGDDLYGAGGNVQLDAIVSGNVRLAGGDVSVGPATVVAGTVSLTGGRVQFDGNAHQKLEISGGTVRLNGEVHGDALVRAEELIIGPEARIGGRLIVRGPNEPQIAEGAVIAGGIDFESRSTRRLLDESSPAARDSTFGIGSILSFVGVFLAAALFLAMFPRFAPAAATALGRKPLQSIALGFAVVACVPFLGLLLLVTVIGIPLALLLVPMYVLLLFFGWATMALFLAQRGIAVLRPGRPLALGVLLPALFIALLILWLVRQIPFVGGLLAFAALLAGIGAFTWQAWSRREPPTAVPAGSP